MVAGSRDVVELERQELLATTAFDKIDEDGNGYIMVGELQGLAACLGLPITPKEQDEALEALDRDNDGVFDRDIWTKWWVQRWKANPNREEGLGEEESGRGVPTGQVGAVGEEESGGGVGRGERITELTERAQQARRRAGTDIHTAAWRGDLALVKGFLEDDPELANAIDVSEFGTGYRPLHYAAYGGFLDVCETLHGAGARALAAGDNGVTALFLAAQAGKANVVRFLLDLGADPTAQELESGLCGMDVVDEACPDIFQQMQEKGGYQPPTPPETPPTVTRVGPTSLQVAFPRLPETRGSLPVIRYKVKVEHDGAAGAGAGFDQAGTAAAPDTDTDTSTTGTPATNANINTDANVVTGGGGVEDAGDDDAAAVGRGGADSGFATPTLAQVVLVPAREASARPASPDPADGEQQLQGRPRRTCVTIRGLKPTTRYRIKVAGINAIGFGPYGPASAAVVTPSKPVAEDDNSSAAKGTVSSARGSTRVRGEQGRGRGKGKGRQVLAMERRRSLAAQVTRLQEQQQREAEERQARRAQKYAQSGSSRTSGRPLAATTGGTGQRIGTGGALGVSDKGSSPGGSNQTQPLRQLPRHRRRHDGDNKNVDGPCAGATGSGAASHCCDGLTQSSDSPQHHHNRRHGNDDSNNGHARLARRGAVPRETTTTTTAPRRSVSSAVGDPIARQGRAVHHRQPRLHGMQGSRPATTGASDRRSHGGGDGGGDGTDGTENLPGSRATWPSRLVATAPPSVGAAEAREEAAPRYSAARIAGEMSARGYPRRNGHDDDNSNNNYPKPSRGEPPSPFVERGRAATLRPGVSHSKGTLPGGAGRGAGPRQRRRRRPGGGGCSGGGGGREGCRGSSSDISVSSCGDMTISSEEQEGEEMAYTG